MTPQTLSCDGDGIQRFLASSLDGEELTAFEAHLSHCARCRIALDDAVASADEWRNVRRAGVETDDMKPSAMASGLLETFRPLIGPTDDPAMLGRIGVHEIIGILGVGGFGVVFKAFDPTLNRFVAIKMLLPAYQASGIAKQRFIREAQSAAAVIHDNVIAIHSINRFRDVPYLVMSYVRGESLSRRLSRRGMLSVREVLRVGMQTAAGLAAAHAQGLIHRDIKPSNILLETEIDRVRISDFGLARAVDDIRLTKTQTVVGTPQYMSPEQARDDALDYRSDLFSLGSVLYEACTGRAPFYASTSYGVLRRIIDHEPPPLRQLNPDVPEWLEIIVARLMKKRPDDRFSSATDVEAILRQCLAHLEQPRLVSLPEAVCGARGDWLARFRARLLVSPWRIPMTVASIAMLAGLAWRALTPLGQLPSETKTPVNAAQAVARDESAEGSWPETTADGYRIRVLGVADVSPMTMTTEFDLSRMPLDQQSQASEKSFERADGGAFSGGAVSGFAGGAGGGSVNHYRKPDFGIALKVDPPESKQETFIKMGSKATVINADGVTLESSDLGPVINHFAQFEAEWPGAWFIYLARGDDASTGVQRLDGELWIVPGRKLTATFDGGERQTRRVGKAVFVMEAPQVRDAGVQVAIRFPAARNSAKDKTPQERFQAMLANRGNYSAVLEDSEGEMHPSSSVTSTGASAVSAFTFTNNGVQGSLKSGDSSTQNFGFPPLPEGRTIKSIHVAMEERDGEARKVPFTLENIPLRRVDEAGERD